MKQKAAAIGKMTDEQLREHGLEILQRELGASGFARFLRVYRTGAGDYTKDRRSWQSGITVHQVVKDIKNRREKSA